MFCFNWKAGIFHFPYLSLPFRGVKFMFLLLQDIWQEAYRISASLEIYCPSHKGTLLGTRRVYLPTSVVLKDNSLVGCVEWECLSPSLCVGTRWSCKEQWGTMILWGDHWNLGPFWENFFFFSAYIISNGFSTCCWPGAWKAREFLENSLISILNQMNAKYLAGLYHLFFFFLHLVLYPTFFLNNSFITVFIKNS